MATLTVLALSASAVQQYTIEPEPTILEKQQAAIEFIKTLEGLKLFSYPCTAKRWTIGYGTKSFGSYDENNKPIPGEYISLAEAEERYLSYLHKEVFNRVPVGLNKRHYAVYASLEYNLGHSTAKKLLGSDGTLDCERILLYYNVAGEKDGGVENRRIKEYNLCKGE